MMKHLVVSCVSIFACVSFYSWTIWMDPSYPGRLRDCWPWNRRVDSVVAWEFS